MVLDYYKLQEQPFGVTPDSRYLFLSATHREALASLLYGVDSGCGFLALIATPGLGKTTLLFHAMNQLRERARTVFLFQTVCTPADLLRSLLTGLEVHETKESLIQMQLRLKEVLIEQARLGRRVVVVIDEAQNLDDSVLELVRMLSNFETAREKLIQIILCGQPRLAEKIASPELEQLRQRVSMFAHLKPFSRDDTELYINHRLRIARYDQETPLFTRDALALIAEYSDGVPRIINNLCFNSLALGCALQLKPIGSETVREVIADLDLERFRKRNSLAVRPAEKAPKAIPSFALATYRPPRLAGWMPKFAIAVVVLLVVCEVLFAGRWWPGERGAEQAETVAPPVAGVTPSAAAPSMVTEPPPAAAADTAAQAERPAPAPNVAAPTSGMQAAAQAAASETTVSVTPGKTLVGICVESFGRCSPEILQQIRRLNPELSDLDHIEIGQKIRIPAPAGVSDKAANASAVGRDTP